MSFDVAPALLSYISCSGQMEASGPHFLKKRSILDVDYDGKSISDGFEAVG